MADEEMYLKMCTFVILSCKNINMQKPANKHINQVK